MANQTRKVKEVKPLSVADQLKKLTANMLLCRSLSHAWSFAGDGMFHVYERNSRDKIIQVSRDLECVRCTCTRTDVYDYPSFNLVKHVRSYPDGYLFKGGRAWRHDANSELFGRQGIV